MEKSFEVAINKHGRDLRKQRCCVAVAAIVLLVITLLIIALILAFTVFKPKDPDIQLVSAKLDGVVPRVSLPTLKIELNVTLDLQILIHNPNHASFKHGPGKSLVFYSGKRFGEVDLSPGRIPASGSETLGCRLILEADEMASDLSSLISDILAGEVVIDTSTRIPGRVTFLGIFRKHAVAVSECQFVLEVGDLKIRQQDCKHKTKL